MMRVSHFENRVYAVLFGTATLLTLMFCSYGSGRAAESVWQSHEEDAMIDHAIQERDYWRGKYTVLSHEADWLTVSEAEAKFQEGGQ